MAAPQAVVLGGSGAPAGVGHLLGEIVLADLERAGRPDRPARDGGGDAGDERGDEREGSDREEGYRPTRPRE